MDHNNQLQLRKRNELIDMLRGIGIIGVVLGHALVSEVYYSYFADCIRRFIYMFHLPLFFFCSGFLYRRKGVYNIIKTSFWNYYLPFVIVGLVSIVLYPFWRILKIIDIESLVELLLRAFRILSFHIDGFFMQPMWFLVIFTVCQIEYRCFDFFLKNKKNIVRCIIALIVGICGIFIVHFFGKGGYYVFLSLTMIPLMEIGRDVRKYIQLKEKFLSIYLFLVLILSSATMTLLIMFTDEEIELSKCSFFSGVGFYPVIAIGIIFCLSLAKILEQSNAKIINIIKSALCVVGRYSFWIMCGHIMVFKIIDGIVGIFINTDFLTLQQLPWSFSQLRGVYFIAGVIIPVVLGVTIKKQK